MQELDGILADATAGIAPGYFRLAIDGGPVPIYRERVYCYELYHQMRLLWPGNCPFVLNGEVDKTAHPRLMEVGADGIIPDLLVHSPGSMNGNHAIIEVKPTSYARRNCPKDLQTLALFRTRVRYQRAIYLIYGDDITERLVEHIAAVEAKMGLRAPIELWLHQAPGERARLVRRLGEDAPRVARKT